ncbi:MAG: OmpA/MotB domain protein [Holophagaceae bacterium]|nr:OmpA/MotB domain protein [Holophagaceae bacterium]
MHRGLLFPAALVLCAVPAFAQEPDAEGCRDHPLLSRFPGFRIQRCTQHAFSTHAFLMGRKEVPVEGRYTEIMYALNEGAKAPAPVAVHRNIQNALARIGGVQVGNNGEGDQYYKVAKDGAEVWVHVNAVIAEQYLLRIVEKGEMKQEVVADAAALGAGIKAEGRIAVYGILFDTGRSEIKPGSEVALQEIAKLLKGQPALRLHVVGHTDNVAGLELNMKLSRARAEAVVAALTGSYGISSARLIPHGIGPIAPVASNDKEAGRAKNRRVELVKQ